MYNEKDLIEALQAGGKRRYSAMETIYYKDYDSIERYITKNYGSREDAKDIFQDGMTILYRNIVAGHFREQSSIKTYLYSICKNLWLQKLKQNDINLMSIEEIDDIPEHLESILDESLMKSLLQELKGDCQQILVGYYYERKSMQELAAFFHLGSEQAARNKKMRCMKELVKSIKDKDMTLINFWQ